MKKFISWGIVSLILLSMFCSYLPITVSAEPEVSNEVTEVVEEVTEVKYENIDSWPLELVGVVPKPDKPNEFTVTYRIDEIEEVVGTKVEKDENGNDVTVEEKAKIMVAYVGSDSNSKIEAFRLTEDDETYKIFKNKLRKDVAIDALKGLDALSETKVTLDHIKLDKWGEFFNKYYDKKSSNFPLGDVKFTLKDETSNSIYDITFVISSEVKTIISDLIENEMIAQIKEESLNYPVKKYALDIKEGSLLKDYEFDVEEVREIKTIYPFDDMEEHIFYNVGGYYGMSLDKDYVNVLRGYIEGDKEGYDRPVKGNVPGSVNVLCNIVLLSNVKGNTLSDKVSADFIGYESLAVRLDTKTLVSTADMTTVNKELSYKDYKLDEDILVLAPISDGVVIIQPYYLECFMYAEQNKGMNLFIDFTPLISSNSDKLKVLSRTVNAEGKYVYNDTGTDISINSFLNGDLLDIKLGQSPFLIYHTEQVPYQRIINWYYNLEGKGSFDGDAGEQFMSYLEKDMKSKGLKEEYKAYMKAAGQMTDNTKGIIVGIVIFILVVVIVVLIILKKKKDKNNPIGTPGTGGGVLFGDDDDNNFDTDDDSFGGFEIK
jgi:hypothetical protein